MPINHDKITPEMERIIRESVSDKREYPKNTNGNQETLVELKAPKSDSPEQRLSANLNALKAGIESMSGRPENTINQPYGLGYELLGRIKRENSALFGSTISEIPTNELDTFLSELNQAERVRLNLAPKPAKANRKFSAQIEGLMSWANLQK